jgi:hypothetical protein
MGVKIDLSVGVSIIRAALLALAPLHRVEALRKFLLLLYILSSTAVIQICDIFFMVSQSEMNVFSS